MVFLIFAYGAGAQLVLGTNPSLATSPKSDPAGEPLGAGRGKRAKCYFTNLILSS